MGIWREARERWLLAAVLTAFVFVCLVNARLPLWQVLDGSGLAAFLRSDATVSVTSDLLVGLISAYVFYVIIELLPSHRKKTETLRVLNLLVASVVEAFDRTSVFGHERPISSIDLSVLTPSKLKRDIASILANVQFLRLKFAMETAHSRYQDFQHALSLAVGLSPEHALDWLVLTDKIRLLAQEYGTQPSKPAEGKQDVSYFMSLQESPAETEYKQNMKMFESTLQLRVLEVFEAAHNWMERQNS
ncbi:hypothetical protein IM720_08615 [Pseudomonas fluorescens]|uniref:Uncharacterized protein n=1 Tax=Pseudomonas fluorescens TaxID=294 RepID=A0A7M2JAQ2_PSEFL|nr:hypothetical protein [Pseudomonas fluorescens]QOU06772.1 hypothetical protein IM720_08615 [Pseudomonas fluorescens]